MKTNAGRRVPARLGLTLLEVVFASAVMSVMALIIFMVLHRATGGFTNQAELLAMDTRGREQLADLARELRESARETFTTGDPPVPIVDGQTYSDLRFGVITGYDLAGRKVLYARTVRYRFRLEAGEILNGKDDNGDGIADDGYIEKTDRYGVVTQIGKDLVSPGLEFVVNGRLVTGTITLVRKDLNGVMMRRQVTTSIELRNGT